LYGEKYLVGSQSRGLDPVMESITMNLLNMKRSLFLVAAISLVASPALADKRQHASRGGQPEASQPEASKMIPGYNKNGSTVAIPDPDAR
jgi:hypothetical protein